MSEDTAFVADAMLGRLARWLRLAGCDVLYDASLDDSELVRLARQSGRVLLTRDRQLAGRKRLRAVFVESQRTEEQARQVLTLFPVGPNTRSRCAWCNGELRLVGRAEVEGEVPPFIWVKHEWYHRCTGCGRIYWPGSHWQHFQDSLAAAVAPRSEGPDDVAAT